MKNLKTIFILLSITTTLVTISCSKEKDPPTPEAQTVYVCQDNRYTGANCDQQVTPKKVFITKLAITSFPQYKIAPNTTWDGVNDIGDTRPEIQIELWKGVSLYRLGTSFVTDANYTQRYEFTQGLSSSFPFEIDAPSESYYIRVNDVDVNYKDIVQDLPFTPYHSTNGFPSVLYLNVGSTIVEVHLSYEF